MLAGKSRGGTPFCRTLKIIFPRAVLALFHANIVLGNTTRIRFGRIASLSAFVLFAGGCVVRIAYEFFLDFNIV